AEDVVGAGPALLLGHDRGGAEAREQALERRAARPAERGRGGAGAAAVGARGALDRAADRADARGDRGGATGAGVRLRAGRELPLPPRLRRLLRLVRGGGEAAPVRARGGGDRDRARRARAAARAAPPGDAARHRGDLVAVPRLAADRGALAGAGRGRRVGRRAAPAGAGGGGDLPALRRGA